MLYHRPREKTNGLPTPAGVLDLPSTGSERVTGTEYFRLAAALATVHAVQSHHSRWKVVKLSFVTEMPGNNCAIVGCGACKGRNRGLSFHGLPKKPN